ncbi:C40 family peptidase [Actinomadura livida]|uniref:Cell wall-associated NlpC family hydrolase n=2 Tax=Actinomadura livida TaxID=79909 RepID=A0A7W7IK57_9ACTN|nr:MULTISPECIES: NlpC/P60 family protein [Actinomadura]MBB4778455.1 cell wall-associated NlpC family hydrolase [Actinomadura catellatispora]
MALRMVAFSSTALIGMSLLAPVASARPTAADPSPSAGDVERSEQQVRERAAEVGRTKAKLAQADGELHRLAVAAAAAVERYNGERLAQQRSQRAHGDAQARMAAANERLEEARTGLALLAAQLYRNNTGYDQISSALVGDGGPQGFMDRAAMAEMLVKRRTAMVGRVEASKNVADVFRRQAEKALGEQQAAMERAEEARQLAQDAVARQQESVHRIEAEKRHLERGLGAAQARSAQLKRARERASEKAKAHEARATLVSPGRPAALGPTTSAARGAVAVRAALKWLGTPYSWGGGTTAGPSYGIAQGAGIRGFDCSGLAMYAWYKAGVALDHWTGTQWTSGPHVPIDALRRGDLVFFANDTSDPETIHHVGIYVGEGQMVEAPYTGGRVRMSSIHRGDLIGATRPSG